MGTQEEEVIDVIFADGPDPDNFVFTLAALRLIERQDGRMLHIVVSGRPVNFAAKSFRPCDIKASGKSIIKLLPRGADEKNNATDASAVLIDTFTRLDRFLRSAGQGGKYVFYDGLTAPYAPVSHQMHALDFLMDRASLVRGLTVKTPVKGEVLEVCTEAGWRWGVVVHVPQHKRWVHMYCRDTKERLKRIPLEHLRRAKVKGPDSSGQCPATLKDDILSLDEYRAIQAWHNKMGPVARQQNMREITRRTCKTPVHSLGRLSAFLEKSTAGLHFHCGGPLTAVDRLLEISGPALFPRILEMNMMMCAWGNNQPGTFNLFKNQFNVGADSQAAQSVLIKRLPQLKNCEIRLFPTETCKERLLQFTPTPVLQKDGTTFTSLDFIFGEVMTPEAKAILEMYRLWYGVGGSRPMFCFDLNAIIISTTEARAMLDWTHVEASVDPDGNTLYIRECQDQASAASKASDRRHAGALMCAKKGVCDAFIKKHFEALRQTFFPAASAASK